MIMENKYPCQGGCDVKRLYFCFQNDFIKFVQVLNFVNNKSFNTNRCFCLFFLTSALVQTSSIYNIAFVEYHPMLPPKRIQNSDMPSYK